MLLFSVFCCLYSNLIRISVIVLNCQLPLNVPGCRMCGLVLRFFFFAIFFSLIYLSVLQECLSFFKGFLSLSLRHVSLLMHGEFSPSVEASFLFPFNLLFNIITRNFFSSCDGQTFWANFLQMSSVGDFFFQKSQCVS